MGQRTTDRGLSEVTVYRYVVITDRETAPGFGLGGVEVRPVAGDVQVTSVVRDCLEDPEVGLIALNDRFLPDLDDTLRRRVETSVLPVVVLFPDFRRAAPETGEAYLSLLIQRAIGYRIRLRP